MQELSTAPEVVRKDALEGLVFHREPFGGGCAVLDAIMSLQP